MEEGLRASLGMGVIKIACHWHAVRFILKRVTKKSFGDAPNRNSFLLSHSTIHLVLDSVEVVFGGSIAVVEGFLEPFAGFWEVLRHASALLIH